VIAADANILLELLENRKRSEQVYGAIVATRAQGHVLSISTLSLSHAFYLAEAHKVPMSRVERLTKEYKLYDVIVSDAHWALDHYKGKDFEDALQIAAAIREKCSMFMTLDASLAKKYSKYLNIKLIK